LFVLNTVVFAPNERQQNHIVVVEKENQEDRDSVILLGAREIEQWHKLEYQYGAKLI
jgi:hypothetical protein